MTNLFTPDVELVDAIEGLQSLEPGSVRLLLTDLPAGCTRAPTDRKPDLAAFWPAAWRALKPDGTVVCLAATFRFACEVVLSEPRFFGYDLVLEKSRATGFLNSAKMPLRSHEHILVFYQRIGVFHPQMSKGHRPINTARRKPDRGHGSNYGAAPRAGHESRAGATDRFPRSVIRTHVLANGPTSPRRHHQEKSQELLRWLIASYSDPGELVVDSYAGSGSTGEASLSLGRRFRGFDDDPRFGTPKIAPAGAAAGGGSP